MSIRPPSAVIEPLEARIAPASAFVTYTDVDGDLVKIAASTPTVLPLTFAGKLTFIGAGTGGQLARLDLTDLNFTGANITFTVTQKPGGDGLAHLGEIAALGVDLGAVVVKGDLGAIDVGNVGAPGLRSLTALSMGAFGKATGAVANGDGTVESTIRGGLGALKVKGDVTGVWINVSEATGGDGTGKIGTIEIGGSLVGGLTLRAGSIKTVGDLGVVKIGRDLLGAAGDESGKIDAGGQLKSLTIGGSIHGGGGDYDTFIDGNGVLHSGQVFAVGNIGMVKIARDVLAATSAFSAAIHSRGALGGSVTIGGSIIDLGSQTTDTLIGDARIGVVKIGRDVQGDITSSGAIGSLTIGGGVIGIFTSTGAMGPVKIGRNFDGTIEAGTTLSALTIAGSFRGSAHSGGQMGLVTIGGDFDGSRLDSDGGLMGVVVAGSITNFLPSSVTGSIESGGRIGKIAVSGDAALVEIEVTAGGLGTLTVGGRLFVDTLAIQGPLGSLKAGSILGNFGVTGDVGGVQIARNYAALFGVSGKVKQLTVGGNFTGIFNAGDLPSASIKGTLTGSLNATVLGAVSVGGDVRGLITGGDIRSIAIGGSVIFRNAFIDDVLISTQGRLGALKVAGDVQGPSIRAGDATGSTIRGLIQADSIGTIFIGGSLRAGTDESSVGGLDIVPLILSQHEIASIYIRGDMRGTVGSGGDITPAAIVALNQVTGLTTNLAIGKVTIGGTAERANIFAGTGPAALAGGTNGNASIGAVTVGGNWIASNLAAGVKDTNGDGFGNADDAVVNLPAGAAADAIVARIASITIGGGVAGTAFGTDQFGFVAQEIGKLKIGARTVTLTPGNSNDSINLIFTNNVQLSEI